MSLATTASEDDEPSFDVDKPVVRGMANSERESAWIYQRFLDFFYDEETP